MIKRKKNKPLSFIFMVMGIILSGAGVANVIVEGGLFNIIWTLLALVYTAGIPIMPLAKNQLDNIILILRMMILMMNRNTNSLIFESR